MSAAAPASARVTGWDRAVVILLGGAGCALSYDALRQMAAAIHVRGPLTYLFPLVIDGFIAYGVRALLVLRDAPLRARLYVWTLFGTATAASIWANALHAVRLNEEVRLAGGLQLGDTVVAILSTIAPLALAGAVHLYILIARGPDSRRQATGTHEAGRQPVSGGKPAPVTLSAGPANGQPVTGQSDRSAEIGAGGGQVTAAGHTYGPVGGMSDRRGPDGGDRGQDTGPATGRTVRPTPTGPHGDRETGQDNQDDRAGTETAGGNAAAGTRDRAVRLRAGEQVGQGDGAHGQTVPSGQHLPQPGRDTETLLEIARQAVQAEHKLTRKVVAEAIRSRRIPLSNDTLTALMIQLREQHGQRVGAGRG